MTDLLFIHSAQAVQATGGLTTSDRNHHETLRVEGGVKIPHPPFLWEMCFLPPFTSFLYLRHFSSLSGKFFPLHLRHFPPSHGKFFSPVWKNFFSGRLGRFFILFRKFPLSFLENILLFLKNLQDSRRFILGLMRFCPGTGGAGSCHPAPSVLGLFFSR